MGEEFYVIDENKFVCKDDYLSFFSFKEGSFNLGRRLFVMFSLVFFILFFVYILFWFRVFYVCLFVR